MIFRRLGSLVFWGIFLIFSGMLAPYGGEAQEVALSDEQVLKAKTEAEHEAKLSSLKQILSSLNSTREDIRVNQSLLRTTQAKGREDEIISEVRELSKKYSVLEKNFEEIASGVDPDLLDEKSEQEKVSWSEELRDLLMPLFNEIKRLSTRPREIDSYQRRIQRQSRSIHLIDEALEHIERLVHATSNKAMLEKLKSTATEWNERKQRASTDLTITRQKLEQRLGERRDVVQSARDVFDLFFRSRVRNLFIAFFVTILFWVTLRRVYVRIQKFSRFRQEEKSFRIRLFNVLFLFFTGMGAILVFLLVLLLLQDWVLLTLGVMFLLGVAWSSKQALPRFWSQAAVLLNLGPVREGERVMYNGVPWRIHSLNFYSHLVNDLLEGGHIRLPIQEMPDLRSRQSGSDEPWFPTRKNDWVVMLDGTYGKIVHQGPNSVVLRLLGGVTKTYQTAVFLEQSPQTLSAGFRQRVSFGVDYQHQALVTEEVCALMEKDIVEGLKTRGFDKCLNNLAVEFEEAGSSALSMAVLADFTGDAASKYEHLGRLIQRLCVDSCNKHDWIIPFTQVTMHMASRALRADE